MSTVSLVRSKYQGLFKNLLRAIELAEGIPLHSGDKVSIKINMCDARPPETGAITHPIFLDALLQYLREKFNDIEIYVVESDSTVVLADEFIRWFGYMEVIDKWGAKWWNLSKDEIIEKRINGLYFEKVPVPALLTRSRLISLSKLKTNSLSRITTSLKNQFGCLPIIQKSIYHDHLAKVIVDSNLAMPPCFSIVDGVLGMSGPQGPSYGIPVRSKTIFAGKDPVAVAATCAEFMGLSPSRIHHIRMAEAAGIGSMHCTKKGDILENVFFEKDYLFNLQLSLALLIKKFQRSAFRKGDI